VAGVELRGFSTPAYIRDGDIWNVARGVRILDTSEGAHVSDVEIVGADYGIEVSSQSQPGSIGLPGTAITNNHTNTFVRGIYLLNHGQVTVSGNLIFKLGTQNWMGIHLVHSQWNRIVGNYIVPIDTAAHPSNGIVLEGNSINNVIQGNITRYMDSGIWLVNSGANDNIVTGNLNRLFRYAAIVNWGTGNYVADNW
jgi:parallel beta-helix repeat protein